MRTHSLLLVSLLLSFGCDGSYVLGDTANASAGSEAGGQNGNGNPDGGTSMSESGAPSSAGQPTGNSASGGAAEPDPEGLAISPSNLPEARLNRAYLVELQASGGAGPYLFSLEDGALPSGVELDAAGHLQGTPQTPGQFELTVEVEDAEGARATATLTLNVERSHWLASSTWPSSASSQTLLSLINLRDAELHTFLIEGESAWSASFSPDGRWVTYYHYLDAEQGGAWYIVNTDGAVPGKPQRLLSFKNMLPCKWAPDSSKLACPKQSSLELPADEVVYFDASGAKIGPEVRLGRADRFAFVGSGTLVFADGEAEYSSISWNAGQPSAPEPLGLSGVEIQRQSPDGTRAVVSGNTDQIPDALVDLTTGESTPLPQDRTLLISDSFDAAISVQPSNDDPNVATYSFYSVTGIHWTLVGEATGLLNTRYGLKLPLSGSRMPLVKDRQVSLALIGEAAVEELVVPGDFGEVATIQQSSSGRWLYFETADRAENTQFIAATAQHWLSRIEAEGPAQLIGEGFLEGESFVGPSAVFSPDSRRFFLHGRDTYTEANQPYILIDLSDAEQPVQHALDIALYWSDSLWSNDSSFISFLGGSQNPKRRPLLLVDALDPTATPRTIVECNSNPAPLPGCPGGAAFQP